MPEASSTLRNLVSRVIAQSTPRLLVTARRRTRGKSSTVESLELRQLLTVFTVDSLGDGSPNPSDGVTTLREAIMLANDNAGPDTVTFQSELTGTVALTEGQLEITEDLTIDASGATGELVIDAQENSRVIHAANAVQNLTLQSLTITRGRTTDSGQGGGGIRFEGPAGSNLTLINSTVSGSTTTNDYSDGGGIYSYDGNVTLTNSTVTGNMTTGEDSDGGGIFNYIGDLTLTNSTVSGNTTTGEGSDGGGLFNYFGVSTLTDSTVSGNTAAGNGGGISNEDAAVTLTNSTVSGNTSAVNGGAIYTLAGAAKLTNSTVSGNQSTGYGGAIYTQEGDVTLTNSTISGNTAGGVGGGVSFYLGTNYGASLTAHNSIIAGNSDDGTAPDFLDPLGNGNLTIRSSVIGSSTGTPLSDSNGNQDADGNFVGIDFATVLETEVDGDSNTVPKLSDNGGPVQTIGLVADSPAIDAGDNAEAVDEDGNTLVSDQRGSGFVRIIRANVDMGAVEERVILQDGVLTVTATEQADRVVFTTENNQLKISGVFDGTVSVKFVDIAAVNEIFVDGLGGDDFLSLKKSLTQSTTLIGGIGNDTLRTGAGDDSVDGREGNDTIITNDGHDTILDFDGDNTIVSGKGDDTVQTGDGEDFIKTNGGNDDVSSGDGDDDVRTAGGEDTVLTGQGDDFVSSGSQNDFVETGDGNDEVRGGNQGDEIHVGAGDDTVVAGRGADTVFGGAGNDFLQGNTGDDVLVGGEGDDLLGGNADEDISIGGIGVDTLNSGGFDDLLIGGTTSFDANITALDAIQAEWIANRNYANRIANLRDGSGTIERANGDNFLVANTTVLDDGFADELNAGTLQDWFFANLGTGGDQLIGLADDEIVDELI